MPITPKVAREVIDAAHLTGRRVVVTCRPALERATVDLTRAQGALAHAQARYDAAALVPETVWTGTAQLDPKFEGTVTLYGAVRVAGEPAPAWIDTTTDTTETGGVTVVFGLNQIAVIAQGDDQADSDLADRAHSDAPPTVDPRCPRCSTSS